MAVSVAVVAGALISVYAGGDRSLPAGADTPWYVWRAKLVAGEGLDALSGSVPPPLTPKASRAGYPILAGFLDSVAGVAPLRLAFALPALAGTLVGLGAGAFALRGLREPLWTFPIYAVGAGASMNVVLTAVSHADSVVVLALSAAAGATALLAAHGARGAAATVVLLAAGAAIHWPFAALFGAVLLGVAALLVPQSLAARRSGAPLLGTPSARLGMVVAGSGLTAAGAIALGPAWPNLPANFDLRIGEKLGRDAGEFAALGAVSAGGVAALLVPTDPARRQGLTLALVWAGSAAVAVAALAVATVPAHRVLFFALGIPILAAAGVAGLARLLTRLRPPAVGWPAAAVVAGAALAGGIVLALGTWRPFHDARLAEFTQARTAGRYLAAVGGDRPVVFVVERRTIRSPRNVIRSALPPNQIARANVYIGDTERLLAGEPTLVPGNARYNETSLRQFEALEAVLPTRPIVIAMSAFRPQGRAGPEGREVAPGITVVRGPATPTVIVPAPPPRPATTAELAGIVGRALLLFGAVGLGWAVTLLPRGWPTRMSVAPALGASVLVLAGLVAARVGAGTPAARPWIAAAVAAAGWMVPVARRRRPRTGAGG
ncbi:MAG: hypothetical protein ACRDI0_07875 [Actinomycetota bacterium]